MLKRLAQLGNLLAASGAYIAGGLAVAVMVAVSYEVVARKLLGTSMPWVVDFSQVALLFITFFAALWVLKQDAHVRIDVFTSRLSPRAQHALGSVTALLAAGAMLLIGIVGTQESLADLRTGRAVVGSTLFPRVWISFAIPLGSLALTVGFGIRAWRSFHRWRASGIPPGPAPPAT